MKKVEVVVIGGSLAGAACVRELNRFGIDAVAFERDRFPRDKVCGGFLSPGGVECLERLGVLEEVRNTGAAQVTSARVRSGNAVVEIPFERPGLGVSRAALDSVMAAGGQVQQGCAVNDVRPVDGGFVVAGPGFEILCSVVVDAAGKLSRFTRRTAAEEFGIQYVEEGDRGGVLDFWFFEDGYGGAVSVEGGRSNYCFLINKDKLPRHMDRPGCLVTGPIAYDRVAGDYIAVGDAAGMVDPFCGEGMRHALDSGMVAAGVVARGVRARRSYEEMRREYEVEWRGRWGRKRTIGSLMRRALRHRRLPAMALRFIRPSIWNRLWA